MKSPIEAEINKAPLNVEICSCQNETIPDNATPEGGSFSIAVRDWICHRLPTSKSAVPLTIAHPAIIIPLRRRFVLSALVIGSMVPDFSKFFSLSRSITLGHSVLGVFWFCVPVGLIVFCVFQNLLKQSVFAVLPASHQQRLAPWLNPLPLRTAAQWRLVIASLIGGAFTHLLWDSFTHEHGWVVEAAPFLRSDLFMFRGRPYQIYKCLQHASTLAGTLFLAVCYVRFYRKASIHPSPSIPFLSSKTKWMWGCLLIVVPIVIAIIFANAHPYRMISWETFARRAVVAFMVIFSFELILFSVLYRFFLKKLSGDNITSQ